MQAHGENDPWARRKSKFNTRAMSVRKNSELFSREGGSRNSRLPWNATVHILGIYVCCLACALWVTRFHKDSILAVLNWSKKTLYSQASAGKVCSQKNEGFHRCILSIVGDQGKQLCTHRLYPQVLWLLLQELFHIATRVFYHHSGALEDNLEPRRLNEHLVSAAMGSVLSLDALFPSRPV